jgi:hypothetical protein
MEVRQNERGYRVSSQSNDGRWYEVSLSPVSCTCPDFEKRRKKIGGVCKHIQEVQRHLGLSVTENLTKMGCRRDEVVSLLQKAIRRGMEAEAMWAAMEMVDSGMWRYLLYRLSVIACEDVGLAEPNAILVVDAVRRAVEARMAERDTGQWVSVPTVMIAQAVLYLCRASKSRLADDALIWTESARKAGWIPEFLASDVVLDEHTERGKERLKKLSKETGKTLARVKEEEFYTKGGLLKGGQKTIPGEDWSARLFRAMGLKWTNYEL